MEPFESAGLWWLPDSPDEQVVGLLKYSPADGFTLSIPFGNLGGMKHMVARANKTEDTPLVQGVLRNGKHVTLSRVLMTNMTLNMPGAGSEEYYAGLGLIGSAPVEPSPSLEHARLSFTHLRDWIVAHPCTSQHSVEDGKFGRKVDYHYESPEPEELASGDGWCLRVIHTASVPTASLAGISLSHDCEIEFAFDQPISLDKLSEEFVGPLWQFFVFCLDRDIDTKGLRIRQPGDTDWIDVGRHQSVSASSDKVILPDFMLMSRPRLGERASEVLQTWLALSDDERRAVSLLTGLVSDRSVPGDLRFLVAAQALEALSRVDAKELELDPDEYKRRVKVAVDSIKESKVRNWTARKLKHVNSRATADLLHDLVISIGDYVSKVAPDRKSLMNDIRDNRNYYTHRDPRRAQHVLDGEELYILTQAVVLLLKAAVLLRLGFDSGETLALMEGCQGALQWRFRTANQYALDSSA